MRTRGQELKTAAGALAVLVTAGLIGKALLGKDDRGRAFSAAHYEETEAMPEVSPEETPEEAKKAHQTVVQRGAGDQEQNAGAPKDISVPPQTQPATQTQSFSDFEFKKEMTNYAALNKVVLFNDQTRAEKRRLLEDERLIRGIENLLKTPSNDATVQAMQNDGVDLLIEALDGSGSETAKAVLQAVVADPQIENESLDPEARQGLAGIKAEVLYHWSALDPSKSDDLARMLPGPVSEKIWSNVIESQQRNIAESASLER